MHKLLTILTHVFHSSIIKQIGLKQLYGGDIKLNIHTLLLSDLPVRHWKAYTKGPSLYKVLTYSQRNLEAKRTLINALSCFTLFPYTYKIKDIFIFIIILLSHQHCYKCTCCVVIILKKFPLE